jgi:hypothetical protein
MGRVSIIIIVGMKYMKGSSITIKAMEMVFIIIVMEADMKVNFQMI